MIEAAKNVLGDHITIRDCFYHLCQPTHSIIQSLGLKHHYRQNKIFNAFCGMMLDALAFLKIEDINVRLAFLKSTMPEKAFELINYFKPIYINGKKMLGKNKKIFLLLSFLLCGMFIKLH